MALAVSVRFDFVDDKGKTSFTKVRVPTAWSIAQYIEFAEAMGQLYADAGTGAVTGASITFGVDISGLGLKGAAGATADIYEKARFQFNTALAGFKAFFRLPTWDETKTTIGSDVVDTADVDVAALIAAYENGIAVTGPLTIQPTDNRLNDVVSLQFAREVKRKKL